MPLVRSLSLPSQLVSGYSQSASFGQNFREHVGFLGLMMIWVACTVYLMVLLRPLLRPLLWAVFLVMGLTPAVSVVERCLVCTSARLGQCCCFILHCSYRLLWRLRSWSLIAWLRERWSGICRKRGDLHHDRSSTPVKRRLPRQPSIELQTIIGASTPRKDAHSDIECDPYDELESTRDLQPWTPCGRFLSHTCAILIVVLAVVCVIGGFIILVLQSIVGLRDHWHDYKRGARNVASSVQEIASQVVGRLPKQMSDELATKGLQKAEEIVSAIITDILSNFGHCVFEFLMMTLYIFFWLSNPMPVWSSMEELFKRYIVLKFIVCFAYGTCSGLLLWMFRIDLAAAFGLANFFLSFIPEIGPFVAILLPAPVILFDGRLESPALTLLSATVAQLALKFLFANIVEVKLVEADQLMKMHPVIILLAIAFFGYIWGPTGMLLSVPLVAIFKVAMLSEHVPSMYRDPVLILLEGDRQAPAKYEMSRQGIGPKRTDL